MVLEKGESKVLALSRLKEVIRQRLQEGREVTRGGVGGWVGWGGDRALLEPQGPASLHPIPRSMSSWVGDLEGPGVVGTEGTLTKPSMHWDSCTAPQQPRKPTTIMRAPAPMRI